jgi:chemotaxis protein methyltransferase CheR
MQSITVGEITAFSKYILDISGIYLDKSKGYLLESRLKEMGLGLQVKSYGDLLDRIKKDHTKRLEKKLIDAISTNETYFFRDNVPFDLLRNKIIPDLIDRKKQRLKGTIPIKIWSAASSTGQEIYSIAITLLEMLIGMGSYDISILGTDISGDAIAKASYGKYNRFEVERGLPPQLRNKYFDPAGDDWRIKDNVRALAKFEKLNLMRSFPPSFGPFDVVFCRNVAIYFQNHDKKKLFKRIGQVLSPGGALIVGGSENLSGFAPDFISQQYLKGVFYTLKEDGDAITPTTTPKKLIPRLKPDKKQRKTIFDTKPERSPRPEIKPSTEKSDQNKSVEKELPVEKTSVEKIEPKPDTAPKIGTSLLQASTAKKGGGAKSSLLGILQKPKKTTGSPVIQPESSRPKTSLLHKISSQNKSKS